MHDDATSYGVQPLAPIPRLALRAREAALALGISERLLGEMTTRGEVPHFRRGRAVLYPVGELQRWLSERTEANPARESV